MENPKPKYIDPKALINYNISAGMLLKLQQMLMFLLIDRDDSELQTLYDQLSTNDFKDINSGTWQEFVIVLKSLIHGIEAEAEKQGFVAEENFTE